MQSLCCRVVFDLLFFGLFICGLIFFDLFFFGLAFFGLFFFDPLPLDVGQIRRYFRFRHHLAQPVQRLCVNNRRAKAIGAQRLEHGFNKGAVRRYHQRGIAGLHRPFECRQRPVEGKEIRVGPKGFGIDPVTFRVRLASGDFCLAFGVGNRFRHGAVE